MIFKPMDTEKILDLIKGKKSILNEALEEHNKFYSSVSCLRCDGPVLAIINKNNPFSESQILPNYLAKCRKCECVFEPYLKIEIEAPKNKMV